MKKTPEWLSRQTLALPYLTLCLSRQEFHNKLEMLEIPEHQWPAFMGSSSAHATTYTFENPKKELCCIVNLLELPTSDSIQIASLLVHEAVHVWQIYVKMFNGNEADEFEANTIQIISQRLMYEYSRRKT